MKNSPPTVRSSEHLLFLVIFFQVQRRSHTVEEFDFHSVSFYFTSVLQHFSKRHMETLRFTLEKRVDFDKCICRCYIQFGNPNERFD